VINDHANSLLKIPPKLFGIVILDFIWGLLTIPSLLLTGKYCKNKAGLKESFIYCLTFRFCYLLIPIIFYSFFLLTENYFFALIKGLTSYLYLVCFLLFFPLWFSSGIKNRILTLVLSIVSGALTISLLAYLLLSFPSNLEVIKKSTLIYDPIGSEAHAVNSQINKYRSFNFREFQVVYGLLNDSVSNAKKMPNGRVVVSLKQVKNLETQWSAQKVSSKRELEDQLLQISNYSNSSKYLTTKKFLKLKEEEIRLGLNTIMYLDDCFNELHFNVLSYSRFLKKYSEFQKKALEYQDKQIEFLSAITKFTNVLNKFMHFGLIII
jgi:hypothetical protein